MYCLNKFSIQSYFSVKSLPLAISIWLILSVPVVAQLKPLHPKRSFGRTLAQRGVQTQLPIKPGADSLGKTQSKPFIQTDSVKRLAAGSMSTLIDSIALHRLARRTSPEVPISPQHIIRSYYIDLAYNKTVSIIFPEAVRSVDLGSRSIIADKATDVANVLKVKASQIGFNETNFSVMTTDGRFYSFVVNYNESPAILALNLAVGSDSQPPRTLYSLQDSLPVVYAEAGQEGRIQFANINANQSDIVYASNRILQFRGRGGRGAEANKMEARLRGLFVKDNVLFYRMTIQNESNLNYDIESIRFFVVDSKTAKLTAKQEIEVRPIYVHNETITTVRGHQQIERVYAFQRFTIPNDKQLRIVIDEQNGGRELTFSVQNKDIMKARTL